MSKKKTICKYIRISCACHHFSAIQYIKNLSIFKKTIKLGHLEKLLNIFIHLCCILTKLE